MPVLVEILRHIDAEAGRPILDQRVRVGEAGLEGEPVDDGLERRAGRSHGTGHIHSAEAALVEIAGRADMGDDLAGAVVERDQRGGEAAAQRVGVLAGELLEVGLDRGIDRQAMHEARLALLDLGVGEVRREHGELAARGRHALASRAPCLVGGDHAVGDGVGQHAVARAPRRLGKSVGTAQLGRLRQRHEQGRLGQRQAARLLAEIGERGCAHALQIAAEGGEAQIEPQDGVLGELALQLQRAQRLPHLAGAAALVLAVQQPSHLHGQRRAAGDDAAVAHELPAGAADGDRVDAAMAAETPVLEGQQHGEIARVDLFRLDRQAPAPVGRGVGAQQPVVAVEHGHRQRLGPTERQRFHALPDDGQRACGSNG
jgi:hypothetical protein